MKDFLKSKSFGKEAHSVLSLFPPDAPEDSAAGTGVRWVTGEDESEGSLADLDSGVGEVRVLESPTAVAVSHFPPLGLCTNSLTEMSLGQSSLLNALSNISIDKVTLKDLHLASSLEIRLKSMNVMSSSFRCWEIA